jgi:uncharacterized protein (TIGR02246 family)
MTTAEQVDQVAEVEAIKQVVATVQHAQRNELPDEFLGLFREDAIWTTGGGKRLFGLEEISAFTRQVLPGGMKAKGLSVTMEVAHVLFIRPDVAAVKVRQQYSNLDGSSVDNQDIVFNEGTPLFVMSKEVGQWRLVACQNTEVVADA